ncbi:hypothetical protein AAEY27_14010 [Kosakonia sp. BYX6]|uniref:Uncharacterized protein n=1 Tax=Kosakonia calanthes TaxID=3139408 RepID=A0ABZ3B2Z9_9ENTR
MKFSRIEQMPKRSQKELSGMVRINHKLDFFLDVNKIVPIANMDDESSAVIKLNLILENLITVVIELLRPENTERYVKVKRYFSANIETAVALGMPVSIADCIVSMNKIRNKYAHDLDFVAMDVMINEVTDGIKKVKIEEINHGGFLNPERVQPMINDGIDSVRLMRELPAGLELNRIKICKLTTATFCCTTLGAFWLINELHKREILDIDHNIEMPESN